jgi:WD40 repeat protein
MDATIKRAKEIFQAAIDQPPSERDRVLDELCAGDSKLRAFVDKLLFHDAQGTGDIFRSPLITSSVADGHERGELPERIGRYETIRVIGQGGMGVVYEARQAHPQRTVALKVIRSGFPSKELLRRFHHEVDVLGQLHHPGIAQVYDAGTAGFDGPHGARTRLPFFAMELVEGEPLTDYAEHKDLSLKQRLELVARICDAVQYAHQKGVIHRDLKPGNILIDGAGQPKILDFGIARATNVDMQTVTLQTEVGELVGTVPYMSPEQVTGDSRQLDMRSDVYSLGVILYELLSGSLPHDVRTCSIPEAARRIRDEEPAHLSSISKRFRGDVETIVFKTLEKDRTRRYQSASDLAADIRRHLRGQPIEAKRDSTFYVLKKTVVRYRGLVSAAAFLLILSTVFGVVFFIQAQRNRRLAIEERQASQEARIATQRANREAEKLRQSLYFSRIGYAQAALGGNDIGRVKELLGECPSELRNWEWHYLTRACDRSIHTCSEVVYFLHEAVMSKDGRFIATWQATSGILTVFDVETRSQLRSFSFGRYCGAIALSPDAETFALADTRGTPIIRDFITAGIIRTLVHDQSDGSGPRLNFVRALTFNHEGTLLASGGVDGIVRIWDARSGALRGEWPGLQRDIICMAFSPDDAAILTGGADGTIRLWDVRTGESLAVLRGHSMPVHSLAISPDGELFASGSNDERIRLWNMATGQEIAVLEGHQATIPSLNFSPDGRRLVSGSSDRTIKLWDVSTHALVDSLSGHVDKVDFVSFTPDGRQIISASREGTLKWWPAVPRPAVLTIQPRQGPLYGVAFSPDGKRVLSTGSDGTIKTWDLATATVVSSLDGHTALIMSAAFSPDGTRIASASHDHTVRLWDTQSGRECGRFTNHAAALESVAFDSAGNRIVSADAAGNVKVWSASDGRESLSIHAHKGIAAAVFSSDGSRIATGGQDGRMKVWNAESGAELVNVQSHSHRVYCVTFSPDGSLLVSVGAAPGNVKFWDAQTGELVSNCVGHRGAVLGAAFSPDGSRLATGGSDRTVRVWNCATGEEILALHGHKQLVQKVAFSPDGSRIVSSSDDGTMRVWEGKRPVEGADQTGTP